MGGHDSCDSDWLRWRHRAVPGDVLGVAHLLHQEARLGGRAGEVVGRVGGPPEFLRWICIFLLGRAAVCHVGSVDGGAVVWRWLHWDSILARFGLERRNGVRNEVSYGQYGWREYLL